MGNVDDSLQESGSIIDNTVVNERGFIEEILTFEIESFASDTAHWKISKMQGVRALREPEFNIPIDITLTKVSNTINPD